MADRAWHRRQRWCVGMDTVAAVAEGGVVGEVVGERLYEGRCLQVVGSGSRGD
jgi:hypothetical protein